MSVAWRPIKRAGNEMSNGPLSFPRIPIAAPGLIGPRLDERPEAERQGCQDRKPIPLIRVVGNAQTLEDSSCHPGQLLAGDGQLCSGWSMGRDPVGPPDCMMPVHLMLGAGTVRMQVPTRRPMTKLRPSAVRPVQKEKDMGVLLPLMAIYQLTCLLPDENPD